MNRDKKGLVVAELHDQFAGANAAFLVNYQGLTVSEMQALRKGLRGDGAVFQVAKARLMRRAVDGIQGGDGLSSELKGQVGLVFATKDAMSVAKRLVTFAKKSTKFKVVGGLFEHKALGKDRVEFLASLPSREVLLARCAGAMLGLIAKTARVLNEVVKQKSGNQEA